jgi:hypothetical protein
MTDFNRLLASVNRGAFQSTTLRNNFANTGPVPFNRDAISAEATALSLVIESKDPNDNEAAMTFDTG